MLKSSRFVVDAEDLVIGVEKRFNSNQPRDSRGRWTDGGGGLTGVAGAERLDRAAFLSNLPGEDFHGNRAIARNISADKSISTLDALIVAEAGREPHADIAARHEIAMDKARSIGAASIAHSGPMTFRRSWGASILPEFPTAETPADQIAKTPDEIDTAIRNVVIEDATRALSQAWNTRSNGHLALFVQDAIAKKRPSAATLEEIHGEGQALYIRQGTEFMDSPSMRRFADSYAQAVYDTTQAQLRELGISSVAVARGMKIEPDKPQPPLGENVNVRLRPMSSFSTDVQKAYYFAATWGGGTANGYVQKMDVKAEDIWSVGGLGPGALEEREVIVLDNGSNTSLVEGGYVMEKAASPVVVEAVGNLWPVDPIDAWLGEQIEKRYNYNPNQPRDSRGRWTDGFGGAYLEGLDPESLPYGKHPGVKEVQRMKERVANSWEAQEVITARGYTTFEEVFDGSWKEDPEIAEFSEGDLLAGSLEALYEAQFTDGIVSPDLARESAREALQQWVDSGTVAVRATPAAAVGILSEGRFKTQFETGTSNGLNSPRVRSRFEQGAFGYSADLDPTMRPIYGYVSPGDEGMYDGPYQYGSVRFNLKPEVKNRATVTLGDSLKMNVDYAHPTPATEVSHLSVSPFYASGLADGTLDMELFHESNYVEAQVHGGIGLADVESITLIGAEYGSPLQSAEIRSLAGSAGIPVETT